MTSPDAELRRLAEAATPGPWECDPVYDNYWIVYAVTGEAIGSVAERRDVIAGFAQDAAFIAAANSATVLALLDRIEAVRALCAGLGGIGDSYDEGWIDALNKVADLLDGAE